MKNVSQLHCLKIIFIKDNEDSSKLLGYHKGMNPPIDLKLLIKNMGTHNRIGS